MEFTSKITDYLIFIYGKKKIRKSTQPLDVIRYYFMTGYLREQGMIQENGFEHNQKVWVLTPKGLRLCKLLVEMKKIVQENGIGGVK